LPRTSTPSISLSPSQENDDGHYGHPSSNSEEQPIIYSHVLSGVIIHLKKAVRGITSRGVFRTEPDLPHSYFEVYTNFTSLSYSLNLNLGPGVVGGEKTPMKNYRINSCT